MNKKAKIIILGILFLFFLCVGIAVGVFFKLMTPPGQDGNVVEYKLIIPSGASIRSIGNELEANGIIQSSNVFYLVARYRSFNMKAGIYRLSSTMTINELFTLLSSGRQEYIPTSFSEGLTISKIAKILEDNDICNASEFVLATKNKNIATSYNIPADTLEGYLFPDTYFLTQNMDPEQLVRLMVDNFFSHIKEEPTLASQSSEDLHKIVILASIVEREYRNVEEAPLIASVFTNRLRRSIGLYSCATVEYIITEILGRPHPDIITNDDLKIDNLYNTYKWAGLTPGPISNPGMVALTAAANPPKTDYYFFRLIDPSSGTHHFSSTFDEHIDTGKKLYTKKPADK